MRRTNVAAVLRTLVAHGPLPRIEIAALTELSPGSVTRITGELLRSGILRQLPGASGGRQGAPRVPLDLDAERFLALGVHIGQLRTNVGLVDLRGRVLDQRQVGHTDNHPQSIVTGAAHAAQAMLGRTAGQATLIGTGLSVGGQIAADTGTVVHNPAPAWKDVPLGQIAFSRLPHPLSAEGTHQGLARAQLSFGNHGDPRDFLLLFVGNLIGAVIVFDGKIQYGAHAAAGDVAHLPTSRRGEPCEQCGRRNCFLAVASDRAIVNRAAQRGLLTAGSSDAALATFIDSANHTVRREVLRPRAQAVGEVIANLAAVLDPDTVLLADPMLAIPDYHNALRAEAENGREHTAPRLAPVAPNTVLAAAMSTLDNFYDDPFAQLAAASR